MKKKAKKSGLRKSSVVIIGVILIVAAIYYFYSTEQAQIRGFNFGNELQSIQEELKHEQTDFFSKISMWEEGNISKTQFLEFADIHIMKMDSIITKYAGLQMPDVFSGSVKLFKLSTETQLESDIHRINWISNGDEQEKIHADELLQASFEYEMAALSSFEKAKRNPNP